MSGPLVVIPTYDEAGSITAVVGALRAAVPVAHVLVVDDASPDGTGDIADALAAADPGVTVLHRPAKHGLGAAYRAGLGWGLRRGYQLLVTMDADGSHRPHDLPRLLAAMQPGVGLVIGSRWVSGGAVQGWAWHRLLLSRGGNLYTRLALRLQVRDATSGYRVYRRGTLEQLQLDDVRSQGYCFQVDMTRRTLAAGGVVVEVPIRFIGRRNGVSKMSAPIVAEALWRVTRWGVEARLGRR